MYHREGISRSKQAHDCHRIHLSHRSNFQTVLVKHSTWCCGSIQIVRKMTCATRFVGKGPPLRTNSSGICPQNQMDRPPSGRTWWGWCTSKHSGHRKLAWREWGFGYAKWLRRLLGGAKWVWHRARQWGRALRIPTAVGCECPTKCSRIHSPNSEVQEQGWKGVDDVQYNRNEEE